MPCGRVRRCTRHVILCSLGLTLITLFLTRNHINQPGKYYIQKFKTAFLTNITLKNASQAGRAQLFLQKNASGGLLMPNTSLHYDENIRGDISVPLIQTELPLNNGSKASAEGKRFNRSTISGTTKESKDLPNLVIILAYMHTGSSYTARIIQNHPGTFYEFEPLRSLQDSSRRGRRIQFLNGTSRQLSGEVIETGVGAEAIGKMITCNHHKLDITTLSTPYHGLVERDKRDVEDYFSCLRKGTRYRSRSFSDSRMNNNQQHSKTNFTQFGDNVTKWNPVRSRDRQAQYVDKGDRLKRHMNFRFPVPGYSPKGQVSQRLQEKLRNRPIPFVRENMVSCLPRLIDRCKNATIRLTKYIRMTLEMAGQLLDKFETLRVVHLVRDPRAMLDSELRKNEMHVKFFPVFQKRTRYMCSRMNTDLDIAEKLKKLYPDRIFSLRYEDLADDPLTTGQELFHFLDIPFTPDDKQFIMSTSLEPEKDSKFRASVWRQHILSKHLLVVDRYCNELYKKLGYIRFSSISDVKNLKLPDHIKKYPANLTK